MSVIETEKPTFELVHVGCNRAMVVGRGKHLFAEHLEPLPMRAAEWMLSDLQQDPDCCRGFDDPGRFYERAAQILDVLDFNKSPEENARELAFRDWMAGLGPWPTHLVESVADDSEIPF